MIRWVKHTEIDPIRWDETIQQAQFPTLFCTFQMLDLLTAEASWDALILDDYDYVMPLPVRAKMGIQYVYFPFFVSQLGIFSSKNVTAQIVSDFLNALPKEYKHIDLTLNPSNDPAYIQQYTISLISHQLDLNTDYDNLYNNYAQNTRRNIKTSYKHELSISRDKISTEEIIRLFCNNRGKRKEVHFKSRDYEILTNVAAQLKKLNCLETWGVHAEDGTLMAGALFVKDFNRYWFWFSGRDNQYAEAKPMFFLMDEFILAHADEECVLDFNGSMNENVARFYKSFGGQPYDIPAISYTRKIHWQLLLKLYRLIKR